MGREPHSPANCRQSHLHLRAVAPGGHHPRPLRHAAHAVDAAARRHLARVQHRGALLTACSLPILVLAVAHLIVAVILLLDLQT